MRTFTGYKKGVNLGGWLSQCGAENYNDKHYSTFITEADIKRIASWGADHVRLPVDYNVIQNDDGSFIESGFKYIDNCIEWCEKNKLRMVLDLHKAAGYVFDDKSYCQFFYEEKLQNIFIDLWEELIRRYGKYDFIAFELLNEITDPKTADKWNEIAARTIKAIRGINKDVKIIIGGIFNSSIYGLTLLDKPADENIIFTFHCYSPLLFTHQTAQWVENMPIDFKIEYPGTYGEYSEKSRAMFSKDFDSEFTEAKDRTLGSEYFENMFDTALKISEKYDVPLYCGEYGVIDHADLDSTVRWFKDINSALEKHSIARAVWTYKSKDFGLTDSHYSEILQTLANLL